MAEPLDDVLAAARERVTPVPAERRALAAVTDRLRERARAAIDERGVDADVVLAGSTARGTWLPGERDVDIFLPFPVELDRAALREHGLAIGHAVLGNGTEEYAEHPYVTGSVSIEAALEEPSGTAAAGDTEAGLDGDAVAAIDAVDVDVVPCYDVANASEIRSAVDRTPFHTEYVRERLDEALATEVRLAKAFATGAGIYGSDLRTRGFSGYLLELLVLEYGGFEGLVAAAADWDVPLRLDPADHSAATFEDPLVVIDPTDPERNVAAVCSADNVARLQHHARSFLATPTVEVFAVGVEPPGAADPDHPGAGTVADSGSPDGTTADDAPHRPRRPLDEAALLEHLERRGTTPVALTFAAPEIVEDDLYPQLRSSLSGIVGLLEREGFDVLRSTTAVADGSALLLAELEVDERPAVERHVGPPVHVREHAERFYEGYADREDVYGPFVEDGRYVVERPRRAERPAALLAGEALFEVQHGVAIARALERAYELHVGEELTALLPTFGAALARYFDPRP